MTLSDPHWTSIIRVEASGMKGGKEERVIQHVIDFRDLETGFTALNRTVRYTASIVAQMIDRGEISSRGVLSFFLTCRIVNLLRNFLTDK